MSSTKPSFVRKCLDLKEESRYKYLFGWKNLLLTRRLAAIEKMDNVKSMVCSNATMVMIAVVNARSYSKNSADTTKWLRWRMFISSIRWGFFMISIFATQHKFFDRSEDSVHLHYNDMFSSYPFSIRTVFFVIGVLEIWELVDVYLRWQLSSQQMNSWWRHLHVLTIARLIVYVHSISALENYFNKVLMVHISSYLSFVMLSLNEGISLGLMGLLSYVNTCVVRSSRNVAGFWFIFCVLFIVAVTTVSFIFRLRMICLNLFDNILSTFTLRDEASHLREKIAFIADGYAPKSVHRRMQRRLESGHSSVCANTLTSSNERETPISIDETTNKRYSDTSQTSNGIQSGLQQSRIYAPTGRPAIRGPYVKNKIITACQELGYLLDENDDTDITKFSQTSSQVPVCMYENVSIIAIKATSLSKVAENVLTYMDSVPIMDAIDAVAKECGVTRVRIFGKMWIGESGFSDSRYRDNPQDANISSRAAPSQAVATMACKVLCLARVNKWQMTCALDAGNIMFGFYDRFSLDIYGHAVRSVMNVVLNSSLKGGLYMSLAVKKNGLKSRSSVLRELLLGSKLEISKESFSKPMYKVPLYVFEEVRYTSYFLRDILPVKKKEDIASHLNDDGMIRGLPEEHSSAGEHAVEIDLKTLNADVLAKYDFLRSSKNYSTKGTAEEDFDNYLHSAGKKIIEIIIKSCFTRQSTSLWDRFMTVVDTVLCKGLEVEIRPGYDYMREEYVMKDQMMNEDTKDLIYSDSGVFRWHTEYVQRCEAGNGELKDDICGSHWFLSLFKRRRTNYVVPTADDNSVEGCSVSKEEEKVEMQCKLDGSGTSARNKVSALPMPTSRNECKPPPSMTSPSEQQDNGLHRSKKLLKLLNGYTPSQYFSYSILVAFMIPAFISYKSAHDRVVREGGDDKYTTDFLSAVLFFNLCRSLAPLYLDFHIPAGLKSGSTIVAACYKWGLRIAMFLGVAMCPSLPCRADGECAYVLSEPTVNLTKATTLVFGLTMEYSQNFSHSDIATYYAALPLLWIVLWLRSTFDEAASSFFVVGVFLLSTFWILVALTVSIEGLLVIVDAHVHETVLPEARKIHRKLQNTLSNIDDACIPQHTRKLFKKPAGYTRDAMLRPQNVPQGIVVAIHARALDMLPSLVPPEEFISFTQALRGTIKSTLDECNVGLISSLSGVYITLITSSEINDTAAMLSKFFKVIHALQRAIEAFNKRHDCFVRLNYGADDGPVQVGMIRGSSTSTCYDVTGFVPQVAAFLACNHVEGICITPSLALRIISYQRLGGMTTECTFDTSDNVIRVIPKGFLSGQTALRLQDCDYIGLIGRGGFGSVHLVKDRFSGERYAVKVIRRRDNKRHAEMLVREFRILSALSHQNILGLRGSTISESRIYLIMPYVQSGNLYEVLRRTTPNLETLTNWFAELLLAIEYVHDAGILHRDVKPSNCMITHAGQLKLCDFGLSELIETRHPLTSLGLKPQTIPETSQGDTFTPNNRFMFIKKLLPLKHDDMTMQEKSAPSWCVVVEKGGDIRNKLLALVPNKLVVSVESVETLVSFLDGSKDVSHLSTSHRDLVVDSLSSVFLDKSTVCRTEVGLFPVIDRLMALESVRDMIMVYACIPSIEIDEIPTLKTKLEILGIHVIPSETGIVESMVIMGGQRERQSTRELSTMKGINEKHHSIEDTAIDSKEHSIHDRMVGGGTVIGEGGLEKGTGDGKAGDTVDTYFGADHTTEHHIKQDEKSRATLVGTLQFMAPEIFSDRKYGYGVDWWAFGVTVYYCVERQSLFAGSTRDELIESIVKQKIDLSPLGAHSPLLQSLVEGLLERDPVARLGGSNQETLRCRDHHFWDTTDFDNLPELRKTDKSSSHSLLLDGISSKEARTLFYGTADRNTLADLLVGNAAPWEMDHAEDQRLNGVGGRSAGFKERDNARAEDCTSTGGKSSGEGAKPTRSLFKGGIRKTKHGSEHDSETTGDKSGRRMEVSFAPVAHPDHSVAVTVEQQNGAIDFKEEQDYDEPTNRNIPRTVTPPNIDSGSRTTPLTAGSDITSAGIA